MGNQLIKRNKIVSGYSKVYPLAYIQDVIDSQTGEKLDSTLSSINHIYLPYQGSREATRLSVPDRFKRQHIWITYKEKGNLITEMFIGDLNAPNDGVLYSKDAWWETIPNLKYVQSNASKIPNEAILPEHFSPALWELLSTNHVITNFPDEEDLTQNCKVLKFKNRDTSAGKGYIILRKNWVDGVNILESSEFSLDNTIYEIRYDFDLNGATITLPDNSTLLFNGGSLNNGTVVCSNTNILGISKFEDAGNAIFIGSFAKGLIMNIDNTIKWYNGTQWVSIKSTDSSNSDASQILTASVVSVEESDVATASAELVNNEIQFSFGLQRGIQGPQGEKGDKGDPGDPGDTGVAPNWKTYVYKSSDSKPDKPTSTAILPSGWSDYPTTTGQWWQCIGTVNGATNLVTDWSEVIPVNGRDGVAQDGKKTEFRFNTNTSHTTAPTLNNAVRTPSGWSIQPPPVAPDYYLWMTTATINPDDTIDGTWSIPVCISGEQGPQGKDGPTGPRGPIGIHGVNIEVRYCLGTETSYNGTSVPEGDYPYGWFTYTELPSVTEYHPYIWCIQGQRVYSSSTDTTGTITWSAPFRLSGTNGLAGTGKKGQIIYPAGIYDVNTSYTTDEYKAPYVLDTLDGNFYVLNAQMTWLGTEQNNITPSEDYVTNGGKYWMKFEAFEAIYTKVGIIANGLVGSAVFNGDYMFSQQGINPSASNAATTQYQLFDADHIYDGSFTPNIMFNFKTGAGHLAAGKIKFDSSGNITTNNLYVDGYVQEAYKLINSGYEIDISQDCKNYIITAQSSASDGYWSLNNAYTFNKNANKPTEINIFNKSGDTIKFETWGWDTMALDFPCTTLHLKDNRCLQFVAIPPTFMSNSAGNSSVVVKNLEAFHYENEDHLGMIGSDTRLVSNDIETINS